MDMRDDSSPGNGGLDERVKLLIPSDCKLDVARGDRASLEIRNSIANSSEYQSLLLAYLEILAGVPSQLQQLSDQVLDYPCAVHRGRSLHLLSAVGFLHKVPVKPHHAELEPSSLGGAHRHLLGGKTENFLGTFNLMLQTLNIN